MAHVAIEPCNSQLAVAGHQPTHANERHSDHVPLVIEFDRVSFGRGVVVGRTTFISLDVEVQDITTIVVLAVRELKPAMVKLIGSGAGRAAG